MRPEGFPRGEGASETWADPVIKVMEEWFWAIEDGTANKRFPEVHGKRYSEDEADRFISFIEDYMEDQIARFPDYFTRSRGIYVTAGFNRLKGASREAFMQDMKRAREEIGDI